uniref:Glycosyltransferase STELLO1 n=1 Tax=Physcomitrium patens TaxID=3218 RepID=A0A2K1J4H3_PHYPA|nr:hypothetical protein PHYPA_022280 [Physcomitrium patens]
MLVQQENGKAAWLGNGSRNVPEEDAAAVEVESEEEETMDPYSDVMRPPEVAFEAESSAAGMLGAWLMENLSKVVIVVFVFLSALVLIVMLNYGEQSALICAEAVAEELQRIPYPDLNLNHITPRVHKGRYAAMRTDKWIVVAALGAPTSHIQALTRVSGWQVLAVAGEDTPADWKVAGVIFLSMDDQAALSYRISAHLPYNNYLRKNIGYLFAIQHGAKIIYDADDKESVIGDDLESKFDVYLQGRRARRGPILQFRTLPNRTMVNPFVHFGQKTVWPRGYPLEFVQQIAPDISYNEVFPGKQFIQQGLANGLPDVDSIFYNTRRSHDGNININFDVNAPPVSLPHGTMAPCNAFNTLFHSAAFWGLLLPVTLSPKTADIVRGYWAQRIVWEVGGMMVVYPPTVVREDSGMPLSFLDEKDLHAESRRLVEFLVKWRSSKTTLFDRIIHLTHTMAFEGFWGAQDVELAADWLKDLLSVGWRQPRLVGSDLDVQIDDSTPSLAHKQFVPLSYPTVHLGVEDCTALTEEFVDFLTWRKFYGNMVLVLECSWPLNHTVLAWRLLYGRLFKHVVVLSQENEPGLGVRASDWWLSYSMFPKIFEKYPTADGFVVMREAVVFNYWNLASANKTNLWNFHQLKAICRTVDYNASGTDWYLTKNHKNGVKKTVSRLPVEYRTTYKETMDDDHFVVCSSDIFYLPRRYINDFAAIVPLAAKVKLHRDLALPLIFMALDKPSNFDAHAFSSIKQLSEEEKVDSAIAYTPAFHVVFPWAATSDIELYRIIKAMSAGDPSLVDIIE